MDKRETTIRILSSVLATELENSGVLNYRDTPVSFEECYNNAYLIIKLIYLKLIVGHKITEEEIKEIARMVHENWQKDNEWINVKKYRSLKLNQSYNDLPFSIKKKYFEQIKKGIDVINDYKKGKIDLIDASEFYHIPFWYKPLNK